MTHDVSLNTELLGPVAPLVKWMGTNQLADGMPHTPGRVEITTRGIAWVVEVIDPDARLSFAVTGLFLDGVLETASMMLASGLAPWSPMRARR